MSEDCGICCAPFTKTTRKPIECNNCNFKACSKCTQHYTLTTNSEVKCMNCNVGWSMNFLFANFSKNFCMDYRRHRREILWNKELYNLPLISEYLELLKEEKRYDTRILQLSENITTKKLVLASLKGKRGKDTTLKRKKIRAEIETLQTECYETRTRKWRASSNAFRIRQDFCGGRGQNTRRVNNRPCITENCKGFINSKGECPVCNKNVCLECNVPKSSEAHECKQDDIETFKELSKNTRPCPKCSVRIHKISGCDQMWCVSCNTAFSWTRGTIETGRVHNPHYFDWLFNGGNENNANLNIVENDLCNEQVMPHIFRLREFITTANLNTEKKNTITSFFRQLEHTISVDMPRYLIADGNVRSNIFHNLILYIRNEKNPAKNFETYMMKQDLYNEMYTILNNYKRNQIHLFRALFSRNVEYESFMEQYEQNRAIFNDGIKTFNSFYKKSYTIHL